VRQFDLIRNPDPRTEAYSPYLMVLQSHHLEPLDTVMLSPVIRDGHRPLSPVDIAIEFRAEQFVVAVAESAGVPRAGYGPKLGSLTAYEDDIRRALDRLFTGF
jgi:toxin CcdB